MITFWLKFRLKSDATFGRGDGVAGLVDREIQHDSYGLPYLGGRTLKGLLGEECANILFVLSLQGKAEPWIPIAKRLFGIPGSSIEERAILHIGNAQLPRNLREAVKCEIQRGKLTREQVLRSLTALRQQTAIDTYTGAPKAETLRTMRVILRDTPFEAELTFFEKPTEDELALLATCIKAFRQAGTGRNRGRGELEARLYDAEESDITDACFEQFEKVVQEGAIK